MPYPTDSHRRSGDGRGTRRDTYRLPRPSADPTHIIPQPGTYSVGRPARAADAPAPTPRRQPRRTTPRRETSASRPRRTARTLEQPQRSRPPRRSPHPAPAAGPRIPRVALVLGLVLVVLLALTFFALRHQEPDAPAALSNAPTTTVEAPTIEQAAAVEMYIPAINVRAQFDEGACRTKDNALDPASLDKACTYTAADRPYSLPGTDAPDIVVIAGHTAAGVPAVFNNLYDGTRNEHKVHEGDKLYVRTAASGEKWLMYSATDFHDPVKEGLADDPDVWGTGPMPGRLLTISCIQPANLLEASVKNAVVGWSFEGVIDGADATKGTEPAAPAAA